MKGQGQRFRACLTKSTSDAPLPDHRGNTLQCVTLGLFAVDSSDANSGGRIRGNRHPNEDVRPVRARRLFSCPHARRGKHGQDDNLR